MRKDDDRSALGPEMLKPSNNTIRSGTDLTKQFAPDSPGRQI
jgi:hypothetical protein